MIFKYISNDNLFYDYILKNNKIKKREKTVIFVSTPEMVKTISDSNKENFVI